MRVPLRIDGIDGIDGIEVGSVARAHLACLAPHADRVAVADDGGTWLPEGALRDAAWVAPDFALRHALLQDAALAAKVQAYRVVRPS